MLKKIIVILLGINLLVSQPVVAREWGHLYWSERASVIVFYTATGAAVAGTAVVVAVYAPIVVPIAIANAKVGAAVATAKVAAATAATKAAGGTAVVYVVDAAHIVYTVAEPVIQGAAAVSYITAPLSATICAAQLMQPYVVPTEKEQFQQGIKRNFDTYVQAEKELITCMDKHAYPDRTTVPKACEEAALNYYFHATGKNYYDKLMK
ncbi:hypothetical protein KBD08_00340 [Candidatus Babeliales bacterium]|nr:hypothetical protein [Candidatus Babeliales bacterium]